MPYLARQCPTCEYTGSNQAEVIASLAAENLPIEQLKMQWSGFFNEGIKKRAFFSYYRCPNCRLLFCPSFFSHEQLSLLYANMPDNTAGIEKKLLIKTQQGYFNFLKKHYPRLMGNYFEMGPDIGLFTRIIAKESQFNHFWLAEPNKAVWDTLKNNVGSHPVKIFEDVLIDNPIPDNVLDTTIMIHVLDHILNPLQVLRHIHRKMAKHSILLIVTHDESSLLAQALKHRWPAYCLQHPQLYNPHSMKKFLSHAGFKTIEIKKIYNYFPPGYLLNHLLWAFGLKKIKMPLLTSLAIPIKLGNIITIACK